MRYILFAVAAALLAVSAPVRAQDLPPGIDAPVCGSGKDSEVASGFLSKLLSHYPQAELRIKNRCDLWLITREVDAKDEERVQEHAAEYAAEIIPMKRFDFLAAGPVPMSDAKHFLFVALYGPAGSLRPAVLLAKMCVRPPCVFRPD